MEQDRPNPKFREGAKVGWEAALLEIEHQAEHWDTLEHGATGHLIAQALRTAVDIARSGGLRCEHRDGTPDADLDSDEHTTLPRAG
jgi:hypothetical protein